MVNDELIPQQNYTDKDIKTLEGLEAVRMRPGMYIGPTHGGDNRDGGLYVLLKESIDNSIDEFREKFGNRIELTVKDGRVTVRDYGRGIPQGNLAKTVSTLHTSAKFKDSQVFHKSVGLNGVGIKAVNALSSFFRVISYRDGFAKEVIFEKGILKEDKAPVPSNEQGTYIEYMPDTTIFEDANYRHDYVETMVRNYCYLQTGLTIIYNGQRYHSRNGLEDLLNHNMSGEPLYPIVHLVGDDIEIAFTHTDQTRNDFFSFANGQYTPLGGTHQQAYKESIARTIKEFFKKNHDPNDIRAGLVAAININLEEPEFESQTKVKMSSRTISPKPESISVNKFISDFIEKNVDDFLRKNNEVADAMLAKIQESERERKEIQQLTASKKDKATAKRISLRNNKLRDCNVHYNDAKGDKRDESSIFITEGNSASGSITKVRNVDTQAVFSLRGKPLNCFSKTKQDVIKNEEFMLLRAALNIEDGLDGLRYNKVIIATDADVDGMHIRLLLMTFFLMYYPDLVSKGHVYILETPLFRVRDEKNRKNSHYCYSEEEKLEAIQQIENERKKPEITRFKGLGEISADEFALFIGKDMRLEPVSLRKEDDIKNMLTFYMGNNTDQRRDFIIDNLIIDEDEP